MGKWRSHPSCRRIWVGSASPRCGVSLVAWVRVDRGCRAQIRLPFPVRHIRTAHHPGGNYGLGRAQRGRVQNLPPAGRRGQGTHAGGHAATGHGRLRCAAAPSFHRTRSTQSGWLRPCEDFVAKVLAIRQTVLLQPVTMRGGRRCHSRKSRPSDGAHPTVDAAT